MAGDATSLLIAYDGSEPAGAAIRAAGGLFPGAHAVVATAQRDPITTEQASSALLAVPRSVVHGGVAALNDAAAQESDETAAAGAREASGAGLEAEARTAFAGGSPWRALSRLAEEIGADAIVCGSRGRGALARAAVGSTSGGLLHNAGRPVLIVPGEDGDPGGPLVIGYDGSDPAKAAVAGAARLFEGREAIVAHVWEPAGRTLSGRAIGALPNEEIRGVLHDLDEHFRAGAAGVADEGAAFAREHGLDARPEAVAAHGAAWLGVLAAARDASAAAVVAGSRGRGAMASSVLGSVSWGLVHNAELPVLVVPP